MATEAKLGLFTKFLKLTMLLAVGSMTGYATDEPIR
jgi:hypothetical protein